jgi:cytochrome c2
MTLERLVALVRQRARGAARLALGASLGTSVLTGCDHIYEKQHMSITGGDYDRGRTAITRYGCGSCHVIPGVTAADGKVGPPLAGIADRAYIGGVVSNTTDHMVDWIQHPRMIDPKTAMPDLGVNHQDALDIAEYLYNLK